MLTPKERRLIRIKNLGTGMLGKKRSEETKEKIKRKMKGRKPSIQNRQAVSKSNRLRNVTEKTRKKMSKAHLGNRHHNWQGGIRISKNRIFIYFPDHPNARNNCILQSHLVAEKALGRYLNLKKGEMVHHINGNSSDDNNKNLLICHTSYHSWLHAKMKNFRIGKNNLIQEMPE